MAQLKRFNLIALLIFCITSVHAENFPKPVALEHDVNFWIRVYTEINTQSGFIHDSRNLAIVYDTIRVDGSRRSNRQNIKKAKARVKKILNTLATGKRKGLSAEEKNVLALWGPEVSNKRLGQAAHNIRFQLGQSNRFREGLIRSGEWRPFIDQTLKDLQMPSELAALPHVESSFNPEAYSRVGAAGIWQFIRSTGKRYMQIDYVIDERMDPFASTVAAAKLLGHNYSITKSWPLALTAYNHGVASMRRAINKLGTRDITTIVRKYKGRAFGFASRNFYVAFLAALEIDRNPEKYFSNFNPTKPYAYEIVETKDYLSASGVAQALRLEIDELRRHNRALLAPVWSGSKRIPKGFNLRIPVSEIDKSKSAHEWLAAIPVEHRFSKQTPDAFHRVVRGDTISEIASRYGYSIRELKSINGINHKNIIRVGQVLRLPIKDKVVVAQADAPKPVATPTESKPQELPKPILVAQAPKPQEQLIKESAEQVQKPQAVAEKVTEKTSDLQTESKSKEVIETTEPTDEVAIEPVIAEVTSEELELADQSTKEAVEDKVAIESDIITEVATVAEPELEIAEHATLLTDPSDYTVADDLTIEVQASETLGHYAEWLDLRASRLRKINGMRFGKPVVVGRRIELDFSRVTREDFERRRVDYQKNLQEEFFTLYRIDSTKKHVIKRGESLWVLALRKFKIPIWLLRQHNPDIDIARVRPGVEIIVPVLIEEPRENGTQGAVNSRA